MCQCASIHHGQNRIRNDCIRQRCLRLTHYDTQRIIAELAEKEEELYEQVHTLGVEQMYTFAPEVDLLAALHERGSARMFMN